jgi:hypothetical protein
MFRRLVYLLAVVALLGVVPLAQAGLIGWWQLDEGTGTTAKDSSGNGNDGGFQGSPTWVPGVINGALSVDGTSSILVATTPKLQIAGAVTITCWINPTSFGGERGFCGRDLNYAFKSSGTQLRFTTPGILDHTGSTTTLTAGTWQHVAATFQPSQSQGLVFYINGAEAQKLTASAMSQGSGPFHIGTNQWSEAYVGMIDDVRIYDRVLTAGQIKEIYNGGSPSFGKAENPNPVDGALAVNMPLLQWSPGDNALFHSVYLGTDPNLTEANLVASRQVFTMLYYVQGFQPGGTYYWRVDETEKDSVTVHTGNVWTFVAQDLTAYLPNPADGANDAALAPNLTWLPGQTATKHHVYFGDSNDAVAQGAADTDKGEFTDPNFAPGTLDSLTTYYWRVDELVLGGTVRTGPVWTFITGLPIDDFESYTDQAGSEIFTAWIDGFTDGLSGSTVGYLTAANGTYGETAIVHGGKQSMPIDYNNVQSPFYSEVTQEFSPVQDWTAGGADTLVLYVQGRVGNAPAPLYVAVEDSAKNVGLVAYTDTTVTTTAKWIPWRIPLSDLAGVNPAKVKKLTIGIGDKNNPVADGSGRIFVDDIQVTK